MIWTDYDTETLVVTNGASDTFTAPYRCAVMLGDFRFDDTNSGWVDILDLNTLQAGARDELRIFYTDNATALTDSAGGCFHILRSGQRLRADAGDDFRVTVYYARLPD